METFNYSKALDLLKTGEKVSATRWGTEGKVYVQKVVIKDTEDNITTLMLKDTVRNKMVIFTPSVENQLEDEWYVVDADKRVYFSEEDIKEKGKGIVKEFKELEKEDFAILFMGIIEVASDGNKEQVVQLIDKFAELYPGLYEYFNEI